MLRLYDSRTGKVGPIVAPGGRVVRMYSCGLCVHRRPDLADLRAYLLADLVWRMAERQGLRVIACQGVMDVHHPMAGPEPAVAGEAAREGPATPESARRHEEAFRSDGLAINIRPAQHVPRASEMIDAAIELIARLVETGHAYPVPGGSVLFAVASFPSFGELSRPQAEGVGYGPGHGPAPRDSAHGWAHDWALWHGDDHEAAWEAPWGRGFPGWHVACSAMSLGLLGRRFDLHIGGAELCFPHHERVRAQSNAATGHEVVGHWVHGGRLRFAGRAAGAPRRVLLPDIDRAGLDPLAVRLALLERHYREPAELTWDAVRTADGTLRRWRRRVAEWAESPSRPIDSGYAARIQRALDDDLNTPLAIRLLHDLERDESVPPGSRFETFLHVDQVLGVDLPSEIGRHPR